MQRRGGRRRAAIRPPARTACAPRYVTAARRNRPGLTRWDRRDDAAPTVVCIGDSITRGTTGNFDTSTSVVGWVERLTRTLVERSGLRASGGFRGLWRIDEWGRSGTWTPATRTDAFDVAPFG